MKRFQITAAAALAAGLLAPGAAAQVHFTIDHHAPLITAPDFFFGMPITAGDILTTGFGPPGVPNPAGLAAPLPPGILTSAGFGLPGPGLGLPTHGGCVGAPPGVPCPVEVDAMSYGRDYWWQNAPTPPGTVWFSVDEYSVGFPSVFPTAAEVFTEGALAPGAPNFEAAGDVFIDLGLVAPAPLPPFASPPNNTGAMDGNGLPNAGGVTYPGVGLLEPAFPVPIPPDTGDNLDGMDIDTPFAAPYPVYYSLDAPWPDPITGAPWTGTAPILGFSGADVVMTIAPGGGPLLYAPAPLLGLDLAGGPFSDDLDGLILWENTVPGYQPSTTPYDWLVAGGSDQLLFSVRRGSAVIGMPDSIFGIPIEEGDILTTPLPTASGGMSPFPGIWVAAENLALGTVRSGTTPNPYGDEIDALDATSAAVYDCNANGIEDAIDIAIGGFVDANMNGIPDVCATFLDCNGNGIDDAIDLATGTSADCNSNGIPDGCDIASGTSTDVNADGVPDECQVVSTSGCLCGSGAPAPCGNFYSFAGCMNSTGVGAACTATGTSSVINDDMTLLASPIVPGQFGVFFMGSATIGPFPFGDGLRCAGGTVRRFSVTAADASGTLSFGPGVVGTFPTLLVPFSTWHFQGWYRDPGGPCGSSFNLTDRLTVTFTL